MTTIQIPDYIDPAVLVPGATVRCVVDDVDTILTVVRVEPSLICSRPNGTGVIVLAHTVVPVGTSAECGCERFRTGEPRPAGNPARCVCGHGPSRHGAALGHCRAVLDSAPGEGARELRYVCGAAWSGPGYEDRCGFATDDAATARLHWQEHGHWVDGLDAAPGEGARS